MGGHALAQPLRMASARAEAIHPAVKRAGAGLQACTRRASCKATSRWRENHDWSSMKGSPSAPYLNRALLPIASHAEQYYNPPNLHPSLPNQPPLRVPGACEKRKS